MQKTTLQSFATFFNQKLDLPIPIKNFSVDTRTIQQGDLYCALPGNTVDGHQFVEEAFQKGAIGALVLKGYQGKGGPYIYVDDVLKAVQEYTKDYFKKHRPKVVIGVTGSLGKTTTKEFISTLLEGKYSVYKSPGNANTKISLPQTILNGWQGEEVVVLEMGMTHPKDLLRLIDIAPPDIAIITKAALVHAQNFNSLAEIAEVKCEIFTHPQTQVGIYAKELEGLVDVHKFGTCKKKSFSLENYEHISMPIKGKHNLHNLVGAIAVAKELEVSEEIISKQIQKLQLPERRQERVEKKGVIFINDSYNAAMDSMIAALQTLPPGKKRIGVLGSMMELGKFSDDCHRKVGMEALKTLDHLICYGKECQPMVDVWQEHNKQAHLLPTHEAVLDVLRTLVQEEDVVLLKGSKSKMMWKILEQF